MKQKIKHWIGILLILLFVGSMVRGAQAANVASGQVDGVTWTLTDDGTLTMSGKGSIKNYGVYDIYYAERIPWYKYNDQIKKLVIKDGVTGIGSYAFTALNKLVSVTMANTVKSIGEGAFYECTALESVQLAAGNTAFSVANGILYDKNKTTLILYPAMKKTTEYVMPDSVVTVVRGAINEQQFLEKLTMSKNLKELEDSAIEYSYRLKSITFPSVAPATISDEWGGYYGLLGVTIYYNSDYAGWTEAKKSLGANGEFYFVDLSATAKEKPAFDLPSYTMTVGDQGKFVLHMGASDEDVAPYFSFTSDTPTVISVGNDGSYMATGAGTAVVTAKDARGTKITCKVTVTGTAKTNYNAIKLDASLLSDVLSNFNRQYYAEAINGVYFVNAGGLYFFSFAAEKYNLVYTFEWPGIIDAFEADGKLYFLQALDAESRVLVFDMNKQMMVKTMSFTPGKTAIGVDALGRIYLGYDTKDKKGIFLYDNAGKLLSSVSLKGAVVGFGGFDKAKGTFFAEAKMVSVDGEESENYVNLKGGRVIDNVIEMTDAHLSFTSKLPAYHSQLELEEGDYSDLSWYSGYKDDYNQNKVQMFNGRYLLASCSNYYQLFLIDADTFSYGSTKPYKVLASISREEPEFNSDYNEIPNSGTRAIYNAAHGTFIIYDKDNHIVELDVKSGDVTEKNVAHPVYSLMGQGDTLVAVEYQEETYYIQKIKWKHPTSITLSATSTTMKVGDEQKISLKEAGGNMSMKYTFKGDNEKIAHVTSDGVVTAFDTGTVTITCTSVNTKLSAALTIKIVDDDVQGPKDTAKKLSGTFFDNASSNNYYMYGNPVQSYLWQTEDGGYATFQHDYSGDNVINTFDASFNKKSTKTLKNELPLFGGFYAGKDAYYVVWGQENEGDSDAVEVYRIVKYSKNWVKQGTCSVKAVNTSCPFEAGSCRMVEAGGLLYVYTCHKMYLSSDGLKHQANVTLVIKEADMKLSQKVVGVANWGVGYVSHSFNQFITTDGKIIYRADHGDAYPRGMYVSMAGVGKTITDVKYAIPFFFSGGIGDNYTGATLGGLADGANNVLMVGSTVDQSKDDPTESNDWNVFVSVAGKDGYTSETKMLTNYKEKDKVQVGTPQLVKLSDHRFVVMWEETTDNTVVVRAAILDETGTIHGKVYTLPMRLSDCAPIVNKNGEVVWFVTSGEWRGDWMNMTYHTKTTLYTIHPLDMDSILPFVDVPTTSWAYAPVKFAYDRGIVSGTSIATFGPNDYITRAQVAVMLWNMAGKPSISVTKKPFPDVAVDKYYSKAVAWCKANGLVSGNKDGTYAPADFITRQDFIIIIRNYAKFRQIDTTVTDASAYKKCSDAAQVSGYAVSAIQWAYNKGLMGSNGKLTPKNNITRAEVTSVLQRFTMKFT